MNDQELREQAIKDFGPEGGIVTPKQRVKEKYPCAYTTYNGQLYVTEVWSTPSGGDFLGQARGRWGHEDQAWADAAKRLLNPDPKETRR